MLYYLAKKKVIFLYINISKYNIFWWALIIIYYYTTKLIRLFYDTKLYN